MKYRIVEKIVGIFHGYTHKIYYIQKKNHWWSSWKCIFPKDDNGSFIIFRKKEKAEDYIKQIKYEKSISNNCR